MEHIFIHALREEGDSPLRPTSVQDRGFLSTPSARRATRLQHDRAQGLRISIHALREEGDVYDGSMALADHEFLSTPSARRATPIPRYFDKKYEISIHALREEGDQKGEPIKLPLGDFYPRPPRGGRQQ